MRLLRLVMSEVRRREASDQLDSLPMGQRRSVRRVPRCRMGRAGSPRRCIKERNCVVTIAERINLRPIQPSDLPQMYEMQLDPESNRLAVTNPRTRDAFDSLWAKSLGDPKNITKAILLGDEFVGYISSFPSDGQDHVGYWIVRSFWGMGIASRALQLFLLEVNQRPLFATVATSNGPSLRVLQKCGFVVERIYLSPASARYPESEVADLVLRKCHS